MAESGENLNKLEVERDALKSNLSLVKEEKAKVQIDYQETVGAAENFLLHDLHDQYQIIYMTNLLTKKRYRP